MPLITRVQKNPVENSASVSSFTNTYPGAVTAGNFLMAVIRLGTQTITAITVSDNVNAGNWQQAFLQNDSANGRYLGVFYKENSGGASAGSLIVTVSWATANDGSAKGLDIFEYSGILTSGALDQQTSTTPASTATPTTAGVTTTQADELLIGAFTFSTSSTVTTLAEGSGFTQQEDDTIGTGAPAHNHLHVAEQIVSAIGTYAYAPQYSAALVSSLGIATFKAAAASGGAGLTLPWLPHVTNLQGEKGAIMIPSGFVPPSKV